MTQTPAPDPARNRFFLLTVLRLSGALFALAGVAVLGHRLPLPETAGYVLVVLGAFDATVAPILLARAWKRQDG